MKRVFLACMLLAACAPQQTVRTEQSQADLAAMIAQAMAEKPIQYIEVPQQSSKRIIRLCAEAKPGAYKDAAINEAVRTINLANATIEQCANKQLKAIAEEFGLEIRE